MCARNSRNGRDAIRLRGLRQNNLNDIDLDIPLGKLTVVTGVSGSGKSSLAFDTLYAEGQRRYVETFSAYTRQFLDRFTRPDADSIEGIPPAVAIDQSGAVKTSRSTVGTMTGINDYLKLLFSRCSTGYCPECGLEIESENTSAVLDCLDGLEPADWPVLIVAPVPLGGFESVEVIVSAFQGQGFLRFLRDGEVVRVTELCAGDLEKGRVDIVVDRLSKRIASRQRRVDSIEQAFKVAHGRLRLVTARGSRDFIRGLRCSACDVALPNPTPGLFSFNTPYGACGECRGFGRIIEIDWGRVVPDHRLSLRAGAVKPWRTKGKRSSRWRTRCRNACEDRGINMDTPWEELSEEERDFVIEGGGRGWSGAKGFFRSLERKKYRMHIRVELSRYRGFYECPSCKGGRLRSEAFCFRVGGMTLPDFWKLPVKAGVEILAGIEAGDLQRPERLVVEEISSRLGYLQSVGLGYLSLDRQSRTLSGGEVERVNLTAALGASLVDTLFVLDEPSIGLHARDNARLLEILRQVRDRGNTVVVVEHDPEIIAAADHVIDMGPGSGSAGGEVVVAGGIDKVTACRKSLTGAYLRGDSLVAAPRRKRRKPARSRCLRIRGARENNLQGLDVDIPVDLFTAVSGVSGSGKSSLLHQVLWRHWQREQGLAVDGEVLVDSISGLELIDELVLVDQSPIGKTPRGNSATYTKVFDRIRKLFASTDEALAAGFDAGAFSFNVKGGRCEECKGAGMVQVEMQFLSDVTLTCEACDGRRFRSEVLGIRYRDLNVHEVLQLTIDDAAVFFSHEEKLAQTLAFLGSLGLGYLQLGQPLNTLSGGESQRLKLASRVLAARRGGRLLFLLDEPTTGLHLDDIRRLLEVLHGLVDRGHGVVMIEHQVDVLAQADHLIDLGPEGGDGGGCLVASGTPAEVAAVGESITGRWVGKLLEAPGKLLSPPAGSSGKRGRPARRKNVIRVVGARENNLKNINAEIPRNSFVVVTGLSGSGKSSLLYDIVFSEGQRRYLDCLSPYARQFVEDLHRPDIDHLEGIPPAVAIEQRTTVGGRKSTVGTVTEVYHFLRLLYTRAGEQICPDCEVEAVPRSFDEILERVRELACGGGALLAPVIRGKKGFHHTILSRARAEGILEARIDGGWLEIPEQEHRLDRHKVHDIDLVLRRFSGAGDRSAGVEMSRALSRALELGSGVVRFVDDAGVETLLSRNRSCPSCSRDFDEPDPRNFSFHSRHGSCPECSGYGSLYRLDPLKLIENWDAPLDAKKNGPLAFLDEWPFKRGHRRAVLAETTGLAGLPTDGRNLASWSKRALGILLEGKGGSGFPGLLCIASELLATLEPEDQDKYLARKGSELKCPSCKGTRIARRWGAVRVGGRSIGEMTGLSVEELSEALSGMEIRERFRPIVEPILVEIGSRLDFLREVGLDYLALNRSANTLSGGEAQRIRLAAALGSNLRGACYILDEPTIGLHPRDNERLLETLGDLRDKGNSVYVIEHDDATIEAADYVIDMGPGPGRHGGEIVAQGPLAEIISSKTSETARYFRDRDQRVFDFAVDPLDDSSFLEIRGATLHNLKDIDVKIPMGAVTVVTGVSGAGKSTLVRDLLEKSIRRQFRGLREPVAGVREVNGVELIDSLREVDQRPIGRTPRSTPATYVGFWNRIRQIFASTPAARTRGWEAKRFSFNVADGRCDACSGQGRKRMEMNFLPDMTVDCEVCQGRRFNPETQEIIYNGKSIADVLEMTVEEGAEFFDSFRDLTRPLRALDSLGLGYLTLGQSSTTLSGGEAQRVKLAVELSKTTRGAGLYLFDEPTTGLHMRDVARLVEVLGELAAAGHAVVVIEHNLEVIAGADWVIDLGPGGGEAGGELLYQGPLAGLVKGAPGSPTASCLESFSGRSRQSCKLSG